MESEKFTGTFIRLRERLHLTARRMLGSDDDAADILQDAFCVLWGRRHDIADENVAEGLAVVSVRNRCIDVLRRRQSRGTVALSEVSEFPEENSVDSADEIFRRVDSLIKTVLSGRDRRILILRDYSGWEMADIADELGMTEAAVRMVLSRARRTVAAAYNSNNSKFQKCHD